MLGRGTSDGWASLITVVGSEDERLLMEKEAFSPNDCTSEEESGATEGVEGLGSTQRPKRKGIKEDFDDNDFTSDLTDRQREGSVSSWRLSSSNTAGEEENCR